MGEDKLSSDQQIIAELSQANKPTEEKGLSFTKIVEKTGRARSTVSKQLKQLQEQNVIEKDEQRKRYYLSEESPENEDVMEALTEEDVQTLDDLVDHLAIPQSVLKPLITRLKKQKYIEEANNSYRLMGRGYSTLNHCPICQEPIEENGIIVSTSWSDKFGGFNMNLHPNCEADNLATWCKAAGLPAKPTDFCNHCGLPLSPKTLRKMPESFKEVFGGESVDFDSWKDLFGPINAVYGKVQDMGDSFGINGYLETDEVSIRYNQDGKQYHPYCYREVKNKL